MNIKDVNPDELSNVMRQYYDIKIKYQNEIILFQLGDFYEMFFEDAITISKQLELTLTSKKAGLKERIPMCGIPLSTLNEYLKKILSHSHTVVLVDQVNDEQLGQKLVNRKIRQIISEGTHIKETNDNNFIGALHFDKTYHLAYGDIATGELYYASSENFTNIQSEILNQNIKELITDNTNSNQQLESLHKNGIILRQERNSAAKTDIILENKAQKNLIEYLNYTQVGAIEHLKEFQKIQIQKNMYLSPNAQKQLEIFQTLEEGEYKNSFYDYLNNTSTAMGKRLLKKYLVHPLIEKEEIVLRQNISEKYIKNPMLLEQTISLLKQIYDFERLIGKIIANTITPKEIEKLKISLQVLPELYELTPEEIFKLNNTQNPQNLDKLYTYLSKAIKIDAPNTTKEGDFIKDGFNKEVDDLRKLKANSNKWLINFENEEINTTGIKNLKVKYNKIFGYFIEVTNSNLNLVPEYYVEKQTMANCKRYITPKLKEEEYKILNAHEMLLKLELEEFSKIKKEIKNNILGLQKTSVVVSTIDVLTTFAVNAINNNLTKPTFNKENKIIIKEGRHPIVEQLTKDYIKNDLELEEQNILLITGPNMAGKSTYMRMIALLTIMAQIGSHVPAAQANLKITNSLFTRIGAGDNLSKGKSTFMVEMLETKEALETADENSLIIFDELGRGTSTYDGIALAEAIINYICTNIKCKTLFSTHYHELVTMALQNQNIKLVHVKAQEQGNELKFYHKVLPGSTSKSYGIEVASLAGLDPQIIKEAKKNYEIAKKKDENLNLKDDQIMPKEIENVSEDKYQNILQLLEEIDLNNLTPIQSLNELEKIKEEYAKIKN